MTEPDPRIEILARNLAAAGIGRWDTLSEFARQCWRDEASVVLEELDSVK